VIEEKEIILCQLIGRAVLLFNDFTFRLCGAKLALQDKKPIYVHEMTELFDKVKGKKDFMKLCEETQIMDAHSASELYDTRNDIIHSCSKGIGFEKIPGLAQAGFTNETLVRFKYGEDKNKQKDLDKLSLIPIDVDCVSHFNKTCYAGIDECIKRYGQLQRN